MNAATTRREPPGYTLEHYAAAQRLGQGLSSKAIERIAQALSDEHVAGQRHFRAELAATLRATVDFATGNRAVVELVHWLETGKVRPEQSHSAAGER